ncbi:AAA family ATPase [Glacieibacterium frigidum]|uniref:AAA family ATPase n=1 Tax=Glacieibacterium frigidum TaxID=2593303 RepID=A0A552UAV6_9SPHN|nr:AAA family ATPase [Glacieibacterium frigidum]
MHKTLVAWLGSADLRAPRSSGETGDGPVAQAAISADYQRIVLLADQPQQDVQRYVNWLGCRTKAVVAVIPVSLTSPTAFAEIYETASTALSRVTRDDPDRELVIHLSPGTPMMAAVWIILAKTKFPATLIESSIRHGVKIASIPLDMTAELLPDLLRPADRRLEQQSSLPVAVDPAFSTIIRSSEIMERLLARAARCAVRSVPVLIEGETGTGKELLARAIHAASPRASRDFVTINCGALPKDLVEATLFGHERGAFTGAVAARPGAFEHADGGTIFLDEIGELPLDAQVKLLRVLQEGEVQRIGAERPRRVDVRVLAATNRALASEAAAGRFRDDLFYRLAVAVLDLPAIRERGDDLALLIDRLLERINSDSASQPGYASKRLAPAARRRLLNHDWPGNVRELNNTLLRASIWSDSEVLNLQDIEDALLQRASSGLAGQQFRPAKGASLPDHLATLARAALETALETAGGNRTEAARLVGLPSRQTFDNWLSRYVRPPIGSGDAVGTRHA